MDQLKEPHMHFDVQHATVSQLETEGLRNFREFLLTHPPIAGGSPEAEVPGPVADQETPPDQGTSDTGGFESPFNIADVPEELRPHVERYNKQLQGAFTRKTQELATQRAESEAALALYNELQSEETRDAARARLLEEWGYELDDDSDDPDDGGDAARDEHGRLTPEAEARLAAIEAREAQRDADDQERAQSEYQAEFARRYNAAVDDWAKANGYAGRSEVPEGTLRLIGGYVRGVDPVDGRWPDMETALKLLDGDRAQTEQRYFDSKRTASPNAGGDSGRRGFDPKNEQERLAKANEIAGRHL